MKKIITMLMMIPCVLTVSAIELKNGIYERQVVEQFADVSAQTLYSRSLEGLSDWTGVNGKSTYGIDYQDKESSTVIYKGKLYLGFKKMFAFQGWDVWAEFTMKIRCKDGRSQITITIPSLWFEYNVNAAAKTSVPLSQIKPEFTYKGMNIKKAAMQYIEDVPKAADELLVYITAKLNQDIDDF